jgi:hypothetical protein
VPFASGAGDADNIDLMVNFDHPELAADEHAAVSERERVITNGRSRKSRNPSAR